jgi:hypothetical protein
VTEEEGEVGRGVREGLAGEFEAATVGEDEGEGLGAGFVGGWRGGYVDFEEGGGGSAAIGVEGGDGNAAGGAEGSAGETAGVVVGEEGLDLGGGAAGFSERHPYTKTESGRFGNHGVGRSLTINRFLDPVRPSTYEGRLPHTIAPNLTCGIETLAPMARQPAIRSEQ